MLQDAHLEASLSCCAVVYSRLTSSRVAADPRLSNKPAREAPKKRKRVSASPEICSLYVYLSSY